ncbi:MAG: RDD family protein [Clostridia bacterium]|nr:RDD family protein [Clostridia bacterium]
MIYDLQKASLWKRASAFLFDLVIMIVVVVGIAALMSTVLDYDSHIQVIETKKTQHRG